MNASQRETILDTAKYLREVRPIDPEELQDYVAGQPHPAAVRQVLREEAHDLGLVERPDGRFEPVSDEPIGRGPCTVNAFPDRFADRLTELLIAEFGHEWYRGESGTALRSSIRRLKQAYLNGESVTYDKETALGYAIYHLPDYYAAIQYVLSELIERAPLPRHLRVVDVGAGTGGPALGLIDLLPDDALVDYHAVEPGGSADILAELLAETGPNVHSTIHREDAADVTPPSCDLLLFANVLSELAEPIEVLRRYVDALAAEGTLCLLAPADLQTSVALRQHERTIASAAELTVYSPTVRLWPDAEPSDRCWSFDVRPDLAVPPFQRRLDEAADGDGEFVNVDVQFSYALLRPDGRRRIEFRPDPSRVAKMSEMDDHVTERIDLAAVKLSHDLAESGNPLFLIGDGSQRVDHYAVLGNETSLNETLRQAAYGDLLFFESVLVLWNEDEAAFNLVVDEETVVDRIGP